MIPQVVLLDRDGVLNVDLQGSVRSLEQMRMIDGAAEAVATLCAKGYLVLVVTNQAVVARGQLSRPALESIHRKMDSIIGEAGGRIDRWYVCDHQDADECACRKPKAGLIELARKDFGFDPASTWMVGDASRDLDAAKAGGCKAALVLTGKGPQTALAHPEVPVFATLKAFVEALPAA